MHRGIGARRGELKGEGLGERADGSLGGVVGGVTGRVSDALFGAGNDDGSWGWGGREEGKQGRERICDAEEVRLEDLIEVGV